MYVAAIDWNLVPVEHSVITDHGGDTKSIVLEDAGSPQGLRCSMCLQSAPF